jgi:hypothetical protein
MKVIGIVVLACCMLLVATAVFSPAQPLGGGQPPPPNLRYQLTTHGPAIIYLLDTQTGRLWRKIGDNEWVDLETPPTKEKKK